MIIKKLNLDFLQQLTELDAACFEKPWSLAALQEELAHPEAFCLGLWQGSSLVAAVLTRNIVGEQWIFRIMTHPKVQRQGLAQALLEQLKERQLWLEVSVLNRGAIAFYEAMGFVKVAKRPNYYPEDAWVMHN